MAERSIPTRYAALGVIILAAATVVAYWPALEGQFICDDDVLVVNSPLIKSSDGLARIWFSVQPADYWPVTYTSFWVEWRLFGQSPLGYHLLSVLLHLVAALLVWLVLARLQIPAAFLVALVFAVHPVNVDTVAWIAQQKTLLGTIFCLLSIWLFLQSDPLPFLAPDEPSTGRRGCYLLSFTAFAFGMLSKGSIATLPLGLLVIVWWQRGAIRARDLWRTVPYFVVAALLTIVNIWFQTHGADISVRSIGWVERLLGAGAVVWFYLLKALAPIRLMFAYPQWEVDSHDIRWWLPALATLGMTALLAWYRNVRWVRPLWFAWAIFCLALIPVMGLVDVGFMRFSLVADRYEYLALIAVMALVAAGWSSCRAHASAWGQQGLLALAIAVVGLFMLGTWRHARIYHDSERLYRDTLENNKTSPLIYDYLGCALIDAGRSAEAIPQFEEALRLNPQYPDAEQNLGLALTDAGREPEAREHFRRAIELNPHYALPHNNLGCELLELGQLSEALDQFQQAVSIDPDFADAQLNLGLTLVHLNRAADAIEHLEKSLQIRPDFLEARNNLAMALASVGRLDEALAQLQQALELKSDSAEVYANLATLQSQLHHEAEARTAAIKALELARAHNQTELVAPIERLLESLGTPTKTALPDSALPPSSP